MKHRVLGVSAAALVLLFALTACAPSLPSYSVVSDQARTAGETILDTLPAGAEVQDLSTGTPYGCDGNGVMYTAHWAAYPGDDFDGEAFIVELPAELGSEWVVQDAIDASYPMVRLETNGVLVDVGVVDDDGRTAVDVLALSPCGQSPEPTS